ncbi:hypothetical protein D0Z07_2136 [Hyphodiscus hymeniophilus]|uniref:Acetylserotonin methytransferase-like protein n=1 Tax=Hyphodiscus hymeniophilus TaxID=353542 RepID=A0A9P7AZQ7_9HELO|nr:hypothetical protein D0Z07_2136 [Hyphodiscus hymeniophilus]
MPENAAKPVNMGLQLFPPPPKKTKNASRKPSTRRHAVIPQSRPQSAIERAESPAFQSDGRQSALDGRQSAMGGRSTPQTDRTRATPSPITVPPPVHSTADLPPRSHTSFSEAPTLVRNNSNSSHSSTRNTPNSSPQRGEPVMRSIFPRYNPEVPLEHQPYFPTQTSPTHIPRTVINRRPYSPSISDEPDRMMLGLQSPPPVGTSPGRFPRVFQEEAIMEPSSNDEMKELWKVTNGWRVSASEGRSFCFKMTSSPEEPVHTLSSATQAFYTLRLMPTSTSAQMTMTRQDPSKPVKESSPRIGLSSKSNTGMEVMSTTLEEAARRLPPNDGLVALLYPRAASNMVIELANKPNRQDQESIQEAAERECGRLVWDEDSKRYYLVHPAIATPFRVSIQSSPAWSRVEYTLEHPELPHNLVRLVRDGAGGGFLEIDTAVAAKIDCFYIVDVAICATMLVAIAEEKARDVERFEAPPSLAPMTPKSTSSKKWKRESKREKDLKVEEFEMDLESQTSMKENKEKEKEKIPGFFGLIWMLLKCMVWTLTMSCKGLAKIIIFISSCLTRKK